MAYHLRTENFKGPFDMLLYLVSKHKIDVGSISIAEITDQYIEEISHLDLVDLDVASDFLLVASTLLEIKAASLIPGDDDYGEDIAELSQFEARDILVKRLLEYKTYKNAASMLDELNSAEKRRHKRTFGPGRDILDNAIPNFLADVELTDLAEIAAQLIARREAALLESDHIAAKSIPVEVHVKLLEKRLKQQKRFCFSEIIHADAPKEYVVVSFLAVLELYKRSLVTIKQDSQFGDIVIESIEK